MKKWISFLPAVLFYFIMFLLSSFDIQPDFDIDHFDKVGHIIEFGLLGFLLAIGFFKTFSLPSSVKSSLTFGSGLILAVLDELHQRFIPPRKSDLLDVLADAAGLALGIVLFRFLAAWKKRKAQTPDKGPTASF